MTETLVVQDQPGLKHRWTKPAKQFGCDVSFCERCGLERIRRHDGWFHWTEWKKPDGTFIRREDGRTPSCLVPNGAKE